MGLRAGNGRGDAEPTRAIQVVGNVLIDFECVELLRVEVPSRDSRDGPMVRQEMLFPLKVQLLQGVDIVQQAHPKRHINIIGRS